MSGQKPTGLIFQVNIMVEWNRYASGEHRVECPSCGRGGKDTSAGLTISQDGSGVLHCFRCEYVETYRPEHGATTRAPAIPPTSKPLARKHESLSDWGHDLWAMCRPLEGIAVDYLRHRRCVVPPKDSHLRWRASLKHPSGYVGPALVALVTDTLTGAPLSLHRTWITPTGKAPVDPPRMPLANHSLRNGCIRLWPDDAVGSGLAIAEGIETALSLAHGFTPVWSVIDAGHMAKFPVIPSVEILTIARDNDAAGISAAHSCAARWVQAGREVIITAQSKNDINDEVSI